MTRTFTAAALAAAALACALPGGVEAHVTLETGTAPAASTYKAVLGVGHGCDGSPTTAIRVRIPEGVIAVKPMPKPGWELEVLTGPYAQAYDYYGEQIEEGVKEVVWSGGSLPDAFYDEFVFRARLPDAAPGTTVRFPVVQECAEGVHRWIEVPEEGQDADALESPAPTVTLTAE